MAKEEKPETKKDEEPEATGAVKPEGAKVPGQDAGAGAAKTQKAEPKASEKAEPKAKSQKEAGDKKAAAEAADDEEPQEEETAEEGPRGSRATARYVRITPRKARAAINLIRGRGAEDALSILQFTPRESARVVFKVLASAVANAEKNEHVSRRDLWVAETRVDEGPTIKRFRPRAMGRASRIRKRTSHITVVVQEREEA